MADKAVVLITGGNTGLGYEAVKALCQSSSTYEILLGSRSVEKGQEAASQIQNEVPNTTSTISVIQVDISSDSSIEAATEHIQTKYGKLDILINNAGASFDRDIQTGNLSIREAFNKSWDTNVAGTQVITTSMAPEPPSPLHYERDFRSLGDRTPRPPDVRTDQRLACRRVAEGRRDEPARLVPIEQDGIEHADDAVASVVEGGRGKSLGDLAWVSRYGLGRDRGRAAEEAGGAGSE
ncbi:hypothetical protein KC318_g10158 [Hortaea werneckii]|nr:hypothetical protein KC334_g10333 [Hortaea werneckii]KAI6974037.1 hypothetical protein KC355_g11534 [Hortaea werneckii]KAI7660320.1 hypothetical protein KC318_g10158 [Hortaea werneckii]